MNLDLVVNQIKSICGGFGQRVSGAADFATGIETTTDMVLPCAFVYPLEDMAGENILDNGLIQEVNERIGICVIIDNTGDRRGQDSVDQVNGIKYELFSAILNWRIDPLRAVKGLQYDGGRLLDFDRARLFWQYEFSLIVTIDDNDGYNPQEPLLTAIDIDATQGDQTLTQVVSFDC